MKARRTSLTHVDEPLHQEHPLGPPRPLEELTKHSEGTPATQFRKDAFGSSIEYGVERISDTPHMFVLRNFVSPTELYTLQWSTRNDPKDAYSYTGDLASNRKDSHVCWLQPNAANGISRSLATSAASLLFSKEMHEGKQGAGLFEKLQLVRYNTHGIFDLHHDSDKHGRVFTVLYYLNGVAGTWFPLASGLANDKKLESKSCPPAIGSRYNHALSKSPETEDIAREYIEEHGLMPGNDGILVAGGKEYSTSIDQEHVVRVQAGDALVFYNYDSSSSCSSSSDDSSSLENAQEDSDAYRPPLDWRGIHAALPATEQKCIATHWFHGGKGLTGISNL